MVEKSREVFLWEPQFGTDARAARPGPGTLAQVSLPSPISCNSGCWPQLHPAQQHYKIPTTTAISHSLLKASSFLTKLQSFKWMRGEEHSHTISSSSQQECHCTEAASDKKKPSRKVFDYPEWIPALSSASQQCCSKGKDPPAQQPAPVLVCEGESRRHSAHPPGLAERAAEHKGWSLLQPWEESPDR